MAHHAKKKPKNVSITTKDKLRSIQKERKLKLKEKRARLIIRNLPFNATDETLKEHFEKFGDVADVKILKKEDGKLVGCAFVQYKLVQKAAKARHHTNGKPFLGRDILVDFALAKDKFVDKVPKIEPLEEITVKEEPVGDDLEVKEEKTSETGENAESLDDNDKTVEDDDESMDEEEEESLDVNEKPEEVEDKKPKFESNDVSEGKTVFVKNVPFAVTNDDLKECMKQFGPVYYALICMDKYTEHSKGTAFVKFVNLESAEGALSAGTELTLQGNILDCHPALPRGDVHQKTQTQKAEKHQSKDSRNLYLVKEGVILAGTKAAEGVSATDMAKRLQMEQYKTQMLRNLHMYVSRERLVIHNLPGAWDDQKLRLLVTKNSPKNAVIKEARIMRDLRNVDENGVGRSKEFGFVTFNRHEDALIALRNLNNNPNIFSSHRRPIVAFSIENRSMIKAKWKRLEKSRVKNPKCKDFNLKVVKEDNEKKKMREMKDVEGQQKAFTGVAARPGVQKMRSRHNLKTQAKLHHENIKKEKKKQKFAKKSFNEKRGEFTKQPKQKMKVKKSDDNFAKMVTDYKKQLLELGSVAKRAKWYQEET